MTCTCDTEAAFDVDSHGAAVTDNGVICNNGRCTAFTCDACIERATRVDPEFDDALCIACNAAVLVPIGARSHPTHIT